MFKHKGSRMIDGNVAAVDRTEHRCAKTLTGLLVASVLGGKVPIHQWEASIESEDLIAHFHAFEYLRSPVRKRTTMQAS